METRHHISEEILFSYAAGHTSHAFEVVLASHLTFCPVCRERLARHEEIAGTLLDCETPVSVSEGSLDTVLGMIDDLPAQHPPRQKAASRTAIGSDIPAPLAKLLPELDIDKLPWQNVVPGIRQYDLARDSDESQTLRLLRIAPGTTIPQHSHSGAELTLILSGSYSDEIGRFQRGDIATLDSEVTHQPIADSGEDCICLIATDGNLKFSGLLPRLLQPFVGL